MADTKISGLAALTGPTVSNITDVIPIVSTSATTTMKITVQNLFNTIQGLATVTASSVSQADTLPIYSISAATTRQLTVSSLSASFSIPSAATQAQQEAAAVTTVYTSPGTQVNHPGTAKAYVKFNGSSSNPITPYVSYGISGNITKNGTGDYSMTFVTAFSTAHYTFMSGLTGSQAYLLNAVQSDANSDQTATTFRGKTSNDSGTPVDIIVSLTFFGDQ